jgi:hypothetical protein
VCPSCEDRKVRERGYLETIRRQGEFIQHIKREIRDFTSSGTTVTMGRSIADRGFRRT